MLYFALLLIIFLMGFILVFAISPLFLPLFVIFIAVLILLQNPRILLSNIPEGLLIILVVIKPLVDIGWQTYLGGFKMLHLYSGFVYIYALILLLIRGLDFDKFSFYPMVLIMGLYYLTLSILFFMATHSIIGTIDYMMRITYGIPFFFILGRFLHNEGRLERFLKLTIIALIPVVLMGFYFLLTQNPMGFLITGGSVKFWRLKGLYHDASVLGLKMVPLLISSAYLYYRYPKGKFRLLYVTLSVSALVILFYTYTRAFWIFGGTILLLWALWRRNFLTIIAGILLIIMNWKTIIDRFTYAGFTFESVYGFSGRVAIWKSAIAAFLSAPLFSKLFGLFISGIIITGGYTHNQYLQWLMDGGVIGIFVNSLIFGTFSLYALKKFKESDFRAILAIYYLLLVFITGFAASYLNTPNVQIYLWTFIGIISYSPLKLVHGSKGFEAGDSNGLRQHHHESHPHRKEG